MGILDISFYFGTNLTPKVCASPCNLRRLIYQLYYCFALVCVSYLEDEKQMILVWKKADIICAMGYQLKAGFLKSALLSGGRARGKGKRKTRFIFLFNE